jgi:hypothetical protein
MCAKNNGIENGAIPSQSQREGMINDYINDNHAQDIVDAACADCGVTFGDDNFREGLSNYGAFNYGEAFAEGIAEQQNSDSPRELSNAIQRNYKNYRQKNNL